jgi:hypothetical protein
MMPLQNTATKVVIAPLSVATNATATGVLDTLGFEEAAIDITMDTAADTTNNPTVLKLSEGDDTNASTDVTAFVGDGVGGFTIPAVSESDPTVVRFNLDLRKRERYLKVTLTAGGAATIMGVNAILGKAKDSSVARAGMGLIVEG